MTKLRVTAVRILTALAVIGICAPTVWKGADIVRFAIAKSAIETDDQAADALRAWIATPGLAISARKTSLPLVTSRSDDGVAVRRRDELADFLSVKPLAPDYWLSLARMLDATKQDPAKVVGALTLSVLTGANEGYLMPQRGILGVSYWEHLPPEFRKRAISDLTNVPLVARDRASLQRLLLTKPADVRQQVRAALRTAGYSAKNLADVGL